MIVKRTYQLGEDWLYYKVYCGVRTADSLLANEISVLTQQLLSDGLITKWFFIRYADPEKHLRLRFKLTELSKLNEVIQQFNIALHSLLEEELVWKVQTETYSRELERYGTSTMELSETLFFKQSELLVQLLQQELSEERYFIKVLRIVDDFISHFTFDEDIKIKFLEKNSINYSNKFGLDKQGKIDVKKKYEKLEQIIADEFETESILDDPYFSNEINEIMSLNKKGKLEISLDDFISSQVHMLVNRAFIDKQQFYEMLVYLLIYKFKRSLFFNT